MCTENDTVLRAIRGATSVESDTSDEICARTTELLEEIFARNEIAFDDIVSILFTATPDLTADFPAVAARKLGLATTPLICCQEIGVDGAMARCVRVMMHCYADRDQAVRHVYLHDARQLRTDLPE